jgi:HK97 family phage portal protein
MWPFSRKTVAPDREARSVIDFSAFSDMLAPSASGVNVTQASSVTLPAVYKCVALNSDTIASLPIDVFTRRGGARISRPLPGWLASPNQFQTTAEFIGMTQTSLDLDGNAYWLKAADARGTLAALYVIPPTAVTPEEHDVGGRQEIVYAVSSKSGRQVYSMREVVHLRGMTLPGELKGLSPIACAKQTIGVGLAAETFGAQFFGSGATLSGVVSSPTSLSDEQIDRLKATFQKKHGGLSNSHAVGVLTGGATWIPLSVKPEEAQFLETRKYTGEDVSQLFGYPAGFFSADGVKGYVTALHAELRLWYTIGLLPRITRIERALSGLLPDESAYVKLNTNALLRMDPAQRTAFYQAAQLGEWMNRNEIRALEDMDPVDGGDEFLHSVQWQDNTPDGQMSFDDEVTP